MFQRHLKTFRVFLLWTITLSLFLSFASFTCASPNELDQVNHAIRAKGVQWLAKETAISRMPNEKRRMLLGLIKSAAPQSAALSTPSTSSPANTLTAPASFDWRNVGGYSYVTPVRDQGICGSCWAFATTAALESNALIATGNGMDLAEQILVSCSGAGDCSGGYIDLASDYIRNTGLPPESYYPYTQKNGFCSTAAAGWKNYTSRITSWHYAGGTTSPSLNQIKAELNTYGPLVTTMDVYTDFFYYTGGIYQYTSGSYEGGHAVLIVGYDDTEQYFIVKNSWGSNWGESGYFKIAYAELNSVVSFGDWTIAYYSDTTASGITVTAPNGSETWEAGATKKIQWSYTGNPGAYVKVELYNNGAFVKTLISSATIGSGGTGFYNWNIPSTQLTGSGGTAAYSLTIPSTQAPGSLYQIKVTSTSDASVFDTSDNYFTITAPAPPPTSITVTAPNGGEIWKIGSSQTVRWSYTGVPGSFVNIVLLRGTNVVKTLSSRSNTGTGGIGSYTWKVPLAQATGSNYRIQVTSTSNKSYTDTSNGYFIISR